MTIEQAIKHYQATKCEYSFSQIYEYIYSDKNIVRRFAFQYKLDEHDVESLINLKIFKVLEKYEDVSDKFKNAVYRSIKRGCIDLHRKRKYGESHQSEVMFESDDGVVEEIYEVLDVAPTTDTGEDKVVEEVQKKYDQRQLTAFLLSNTNEQTLTSALAFIQTDSYRKAAKLIGTTDKTVKSRIRSLSKRFDTNQFGNYYDYFTTATVHIG